MGLHQALLRSFAPAISVPGSGARDFRGVGRWPLLDGASIRVVLIERRVSPVPVVVVHVLLNEATQMLSVERDEMVQELAAAASRSRIVPV